MRHLRAFALLLWLTALLPCAVLGDAATPEMDALAREMAQAEIDALLEDATGWVAVMLSDVRLGETEQSKTSVTIYLTVPSLKNTLRSSVSPEDMGAQEYLAQALDDYMNHETREELKLNFTYKTDSSGAVTTKWSGVSNPRNLLSKLKNLAGSAKKSYTYKNTRAAVAAYLLPQAADMPKREPDEMPEMASLAEYAAQVAPVLGLSAAQAEGRLRCLLLMMELTQMDTAAPLEETVLTVKVDDWAAMLQSAETLAAEKLDAAIGAPEMTAEEVEAFLWEALPEAMLPLLYDKKGVQETEITVDLAAAVREGPQASGGLMTYFAAYSAEVDAVADRLTAYAAALPYYPRATAISSTVLSGGEAAEGVRVTFDMGDDTENGGYVRVCRDGAEVLSGYIRQQVRLTVRLEPGEYTVYYSKGPEWYGETYLFGHEAEFGVFSLTVPEEGRLVVHMQKGSGSIAVTGLTQEEFLEQAPEAAEAE